MIKKRGETGKRKERLEYGGGRKRREKLGESSEDEKRMERET